MYFRRDEIEKLNPWSELTKKPPFVLRLDREFVDRHNAEQTRSDFKTSLCGKPRDRPRCLTDTHASVG
jgi:hypothetical protein